MPVLTRECLCVLFPRVCRGYQRPTHMLQALHMANCHASQNKTVSEVV